MTLVAEVLDVIVVWRILLLLSALSRGAKCTRRRTLPSWVHLFRISLIHL